MNSGDVGAVRRFNRLVTQRVGALEDHFLGRSRPLGASRLLYEIGTRGANLRDVRERLGLDAGYLSRLLATLAAEGLVTAGPDPSDRRVRTARLTAAGRREVREMNRRSDRRAADLLEALPPKQRTALVAAMGHVHGLLSVAALRIDPVAPADPVSRWCVAQYFAELQRRFEHGFDATAALPVRDAELVPPHGVFLVASIDGQPVASGAVKLTAPRVATIKRMWVSGTVRGLGVGRRMLQALEDHARALGVVRLQLETNAALTEAIALYRSAGFTEVEPFNDEPHAHHWFEKRLPRARATTRRSR